MSKLIIVCGLPGSGKTTLARELSRELNIVCLHKDCIKEKIFEIRKGKSLDESKAIGAETMRLFFHLAEDQVKNGVDVIIESPLSFPEDYEKFRQWEVNYGTKIYSIICSIDIEERGRRFALRERHYAHFDKERDVISRHFNGAEYDYKDIPGEQIRMITNKPVRDLVASAVKIITKITKY